jgi:Ca2+-binding EF-hand superfamily protein
VEAPFDPHTMAFEQGDEGDSFYVILEGSFEVLIRDRGGRGEKVEKLLTEGQFFGERALLRDEPRNASVRCKQRARTMAITRDQFEAALGTPLKELMPVLEETKHARDAVDEDGDKQLDYDEFCALVALREKGHFTQEQLRERFDALDLDGSGYVDLNEYDAYRLKEAQERRRMTQMVNDGFEALDEDGDQQLSFNEFCVLVSLCEKGSFTQEELHARFDMLDVDGSGQLDLAEYDRFRASLVKKPGHAHEKGARKKNTRSLKRRDSVM